MGTAGHGHVMDECSKGSNALFYSQAFFVWNTQVSCRPEEREAVSGCKRLWASPWGCPSLLPARAQAPLLWDKALCVLQEGAHGWLVDLAAFSGAAKLRRLRGRVELGSLARKQPGGLGTAASSRALAWRLQEGIMPLFRLRSAMVLRL